MTFKVNKNDRSLLTSLAEHRVLTVSQVAAIQKKTEQVARRRLRMLEQEELILSMSRGLGRNRGRPEKVFSLADKGVDFLRAGGIDMQRNPNDKVNAEGTRCLDHQLLVNWFRIHLSHIEHVIPHLSIQFLSPTSPFLPKDHNHRTPIFEQLPAKGESDRSNGFTPDGVFSVTHKESEKTLLFFLEVDMGTESIASPKRDPRDIRQKVVNYQQYFQSGRYKRYEKIWNCILKGFRLLFLTNTQGRLSALCRLVQEMPPSDFIWLTTSEQMLAHGLSAEIWVRGGRQDAPPQSILGPQMACRAAIIPLKL